MTQARVLSAGSARGYRRGRRNRSCSIMRAPGKRSGLRSIGRRFDLGWLALGRELSRSKARQVTGQLCPSSGSGRKLSLQAAGRLAGVCSDYDILIVVADGLSASAIDTNAVPLARAIVALLSARQLSMAPLVLASQARVALGDPIAEIVGARISIVIIGERPGLSAADSVGVYVTSSPRPGTPDSRRNCISNIRAGGLAIDRAADGVASLVADMLITGISGIGLKDALVGLPRD